MVQVTLCGVVTDGSKIANGKILIDSGPHATPMSRCGYLRHTNFPAEIFVCNCRFH